MFLACCFFTCPSREPIFCYVLHLLCAVHWCALGLRLRLMFHTPSPEPSRAEPRREAAVRCIVCTRMFSSLLRHFLRSSARPVFGVASATRLPLALRSLTSTSRRHYYSFASIVYNVQYLTFC